MAELTRVATLEHKNWKYKAGGGQQLEQSIVERPIFQNFRNFEY